MGVDATGVRVHRIRLSWCRVFGAGCGVPSAWSGISSSGCLISTAGCSSRCWISGAGC